MVTALHTHWCYVNDMAKSVVFYRTAFGIDPVFESPFWTEFSVGGQKFALHAGSTGGQGGFFLALVTPDLTHARSHLAALGVSVGEVHETPSGNVCTVTDLDGNHLQLIETRSPSH